MKPTLLLALAAALFSGCATKDSQNTPIAATSGADGKSVVDGKSTGAGDDLEMYAVAEVPDPLAPVNRVTFWINHQLYVYAFQPIADGYEFLIPGKGREAVSNVYDNIGFPVRLVNNLLQGKWDRAGKETGSFVVNTTIGVAGIGRPARHMSALGDIPPADTAQTFALWGIPNGCYLVLPLLGPSTLRDGVGRAGDWALNPITWGGFVSGNPIWFIAIPSVNTLRSLPAQMDVYDAATEGAVDRYLATRSAYILYRKEFNSR